MIPRPHSHCGPDPLSTGHLARPSAALLLLVGGLVVLLVAGLEACQEPQPAIQSASGLVISVDGPDVARVDRFTLRTADGMQLQFEVESLALDGGGKPAPHLREHMVSGEPIEVDFYRGCCDQLVALRYRDAHDAGPTPAGSPTPLGGNDG